MKRLAGLTALALIITGTGGCSWLGFRDRGSDYLQAQQTAPMRLPEGVQAKHLDPLLPIPTQIPSLAARDDEFETPRPQALAAGPDSGEFSLQKSGDARWLLALGPPAEVWPLARQYFERNGLAIAEERPQTGEFITAWQRYDRLSPELSRRLGGRVTVAAPDGRKVLPVFTSVTALQTWDAMARPVPADGRRTALAAASEDTELIVIDPASETEFVLRRPAVWAIAQGEAWEPAHTSPTIFTGLQESISGELAVLDLAVESGDPTGRLRGPELVVHLQLMSGLEQDELDAVLARIARRWAADDRIAVLVDSLTVKLVRA